MDDTDLSHLTASGSKANGNVRYITISDNKPEHWDDLINIAKSSYTYFWYIIHDKDDTDKHLHLVCYDRSGTSLKSHCSRFSSVVPSNMVCKVKTPRAMLRYLIHKDQPSKFQYDKELVISNCSSQFLQSIGDSKATLDKFGDIQKIRKHEMSVQEFVEKYDFEISKLNIYQQVSLADKLSRLV